MLINIEYLFNKYLIEPKNISHFGAHVGQEVQSYIDLGFQHINLFEPQKDIFEILVKSFGSDNRITLFNIGLGSSNQVVPIYSDKENRGESASVLKPKKHKILYPDITFEVNEEINIKRYDSLDIKDVNFLVLDIQGYELEALKGAQGELISVDYIYTEINREDLYENNTLINDLDKYLAKFNFIRVETRWAKNGLLPWGDGFYLKENKIKLSTLILNKIKNSYNTSKIYYFYLKIKFHLKFFIKDKLI